MTTINIDIYDETEDNTIHSTGVLNLDNGDIQNVQCGTPHSKNPKLEFSKTYMFTSGKINVQHKEIEFAVQNAGEKGYSITKEELREIATKISHLLGNT